jgi:hypothetical protein
VDSDVVAVDNKIRRGPYSKVNEAICVQFLAYMNDHDTSVAAAASSVGLRLVFLPAYSPMLNPIEFLFSKWKQQIKTSNVPYTRGMLLSLIETGRQSICTNDCLGWIRECERNMLRCIQRQPLD